MPLYTIITQTAVLSGSAKAKLAGELTAFHSEYAGVPRNWVHVVFQDYAPGSGFTAGEASATIHMPETPKDRVGLDTPDLRVSGSLASCAPTVPCPPKCYPALNHAH